MSAYYTQWCKEHGEWEMDIDNPSECPKCIELGMTEIQQLRRLKLDLETELTNLKFAFARLREDRDRFQQRLIEFGVDQ